MPLEAHAEGPQDGEEFVEVEADLQRGQAEGKEQRMLAEEKLEGFARVFEHGEVHADAIVAARAAQRG